MSDEPEGLGREAGPDFQAAGGPAPEPPPRRRRVRRSDTSAAAPGPTPGQTPGPTPTRTPDQVPARRPGPPRLLIGAAAALLLIVVTLAVVAPQLAANWRAADPRPTEAPFTPQPAQRMQGPYFSFTSPEGWARSSTWGQGNVAELVDRDDNEITVYAWTDQGAEDRCQRELTSLEIWVPGEISTLPARRIDRLAAPGGMLRGHATDDGMYLERCVQYQDLVVQVSGKLRYEDEAAGTAAYDGVLDSWRWRR